MPEVADPFHKVPVTYVTCALCGGDKQRQDDPIPHDCAPLRAYRAAVANHGRDQLLEAVAAAEKVSTSRAK